MRWGKYTTILVAAFLLATPAFSDSLDDFADQRSKAEIEVLQEKASQLMGDIELLHRSTFQLRREVNKIDSDISDAKEGDYLKRIKTLKPKLDYGNQLLDQQTSELSQKMYLLGVVEEKLYWLHDQLGGPLIETISRRLNPEEYEDEDL